MEPALKGVTLKLTQVFQRLSGQAVTPHGTFELADVSLRGREVRFAFPATANRDGPRNVFRGRVDGATMQGDLEAPGGKSRNIDWKASRSVAPAEALAK